MHPKFHIDTIKDLYILFNLMSMHNFVFLLQLSLVGNKYTQRRISMEANKFLGSNNKYIIEKI